MSFTAIAGILGTLVVGAAVGIVVGALGAGGGILSVPVLVFLLHQAPHDATAASLVIVAVTAAFSIIPHARRGNVQWKEGALFGSLCVVGSVIGSKLQDRVSGDLLLYLFSVLLVGVAIFMAKRARDAHRLSVSQQQVRGDGGVSSSASVGTTSKDNGDNSSREVKSKIRLVPLIGFAAMTGFLTGFFGVGGGFMVVPVLVLALGLPMRLASGTSLMVMIITAAAGLAARFNSDVTIDWVVIGIFIVGSVVGGLLGEKITRKARDYQLTYVFALLLALVAVGTFVGTVMG